MYKTITKVIANRLLHVLDDLISLNQSDFVKDRLIMSNVLVCQDLVRGYHRSNGPPRCLMKIDLRKAYDFVLLGLSLSKYYMDLDFPLYLLTELCRV